MFAWAAEHEPMPDNSTNRFQQFLDKYVPCVVTLLQKSNLQPEQSFAPLKSEMEIRILRVCHQDQFGVARRQPNRRRVDPLYGFLMRCSGSTVRGKLLLQPIDMLETPSHQRARNVRGLQGSDEDNATRVFRSEWI